MLFTRIQVETFGWKASTFKKNEQKNPHLPLMLEPGKDFFKVAFEIELFDSCSLKKKALTNIF